MERIASVFKHVLWWSDFKDIMVLSFDQTLRSEKAKQEVLCDANQFSIKYINQRRKAYIRRRLYHQINLAREIVFSGMSVTTHMFAGKSARLDGGVLKNMYI